MKINPNKVISGGLMVAKIIDCSVSTSSAKISLHLIYMSFQVEFFGETPSVHEGADGVMLVTHPDGSSTGDAFVLFKTEGEGQIALKKHRENIGKRYVELFRSTRAELQQVCVCVCVTFHTSCICELSSHPQLQKYKIFLRYIIW